MASVISSITNGANYAEIEVLNAKLLRELKLENGKLNLLLAAARLKIHAFKNVYPTKRYPHTSNAKL